MLCFFSFCTFAIAEHEELVVSYDLKIKSIDFHNHDFYLLQNDIVIRLTSWVTCVSIFVIWFFKKCTIFLFFLDSIASCKICFCDFKMLHIRFRPYILVYTEGFSYLKVAWKFIDNFKKGSLGSCSKEI